MAIATASMAMIAAPRITSENNISIRAAFALRLRAKTFRIFRSRASAPGVRLGVERDARSDDGTASTEGTSSAVSFAMDNAALAAMVLELHQAFVPDAMPTRLMEQPTN
jgi:hypothetical protein